MAASTASMCLRRLSLAVYSQTSSQAAARFIRRLEARGLGLEEECNMPNHLPYSSLKPQDSNLLKIGRACGGRLLGLGGGLLFLGVDHFAPRLFVLVTLQFLGELLLLIFLADVHRLLRPLARLGEVARLG